MRLALALWMAFLVAQGVKSFLKPDKHAVYPIFANASQHWLQDEPLYGEEDGFFYSPAFAAALTPLAVLPLSVGGVLWGGLNIAVIFWALRAFFREVLLSLRPGADEGKFLALALAATVHGAWSGQSNALVLALVLFAFCQAGRDKWWWTALLLAVAVHIKVWPIVAAALLALRWYRPLLPRLAVCLPVVGLLPLLTKPPEKVLLAYQQWGQCLVERFSGGGRYGGYRDAWTIWEELIPPVYPTLYMVLQISAGILVALWCLWQIRRGVTSRAYLLAVVAAWASWQLLFGPGTERLTYGIIAPAVSWAVIESYAVRRDRGLALAAWTLTGPAGTGEIERVLLRFMPFAEVLLPLGVILLVVWFVRAAGQFPVERSIARENANP